MNFNFTPEQQQFRDAVLRFSREQLQGNAKERAHSPDYPWDVAKLMAAQGLLGLTIRGSQIDHRTCDFVLALSGQTADQFERLIEKLAHTPRIHRNGWRQKPPAVSMLIVQEAPQFRERDGYLKMVAETGKGPKDQIASMGCSIKWG